jgi:hypothetical protein
MASIYSRKAYTDPVTLQHLPYTSQLSTRTDCHSATYPRIDCMCQWCASKEPGGLSIYVELDFSSQRLNIGRGFSELSNLDQPMSECWLYVLRMPRRLVLPSSSNPCTILHLWVWMGMCKLQRWVLLHSRPHCYTRWLDEHHHITSCELYIIINHSKHDKPYHQCCYTSVSRHRGTNGNWNNYLHRWIGCHGG